MFYVFIVYHVCFQISMSKNILLIKTWLFIINFFLIFVPAKGKPGAHGTEQKP